MKDNIKQALEELERSDFLRVKQIEYSRLEVIKKRVELAKNDQLMTPQQFYISDVEFLLELLKGN